MNTQQFSKDNVLMSIVLIAALTAFGFSAISSDVDADAAVSVAAAQAQNQV